MWRGDEDAQLPPSEVEEGAVGEAPSGDIPGAGEAPMEEFDALSHPPATSADLEAEAGPSVLSEAQLEAALGNFRAELEAVPHYELPTTDVQLDVPLDVLLDIPLNVPLDIPLDVLQVGQGGDLLQHGSEQQPPIGQQQPPIEEQDLKAAEEPMQPPATPEDHLATSEEVSATPDDPATPDHLEHDARQGLEEDLLAEPLLMGGGDKALNPTEAEAVKEAGGEAVEKEAEDAEATSGDVEGEPFIRSGPEAVPAALLAPMEEESLPSFASEPPQLVEADLPMEPLSSFTVPDAAEPVTADPATADPVTADPATADPATLDPAAADPAIVELSPPEIDLTLDETSQPSPPETGESTIVPAAEPSLGVSLLASGQPQEEEPTAASDLLPPDEHDPTLNRLLPEPASEPTDTQIDIQMAAEPTGIIQTESLMAAEATDVQMESLMAAEAHLDPSLSGVHEEVSAPEVGSAALDVGGAAEGHHEAEEGRSGSDLDPEQAAAEHLGSEGGHSGDDAAAAAAAESYGSPDRSHMSAEERQAWEAWDAWAIRCEGLRGGE